MISSLGQYSIMARAPQRLVRVFFLFPFFFLFAKYEYVSTIVPCTRLESMHSFVILYSRKRQRFSSSSSVPPAAHILEYLGSCSFSL